MPKGRHPDRSLQNWPTTCSSLERAPGGGQKSGQDQAALRHRCWAEQSDRLGVDQPFYRELRPSRHTRPRQDRHDLLAWLHPLDQLGCGRPSLHGSSQECRPLVRHASIWCGAQISLSPRSFSASSLNASGTERFRSIAPVAYPTASRPKRWQMASISPRQVAPRLRHPPRIIDAAC